jgi:hypothetical protein
MKIPSVTTVLAIYGAALATINVIWAWAGKRRRIHVNLSWAIPAYTTHLGSDVLSIEAVNRGQQPVNLKSAGFLMSDKRQIVLPQANGTHQLPHQLNGGDSCSVWADPGGIAFELKRHGYSGLIELRGFYVDGTGSQRSSKRFKFDVEKNLPYETSH